MSLFQRITTPFGEISGDDPPVPDAAYAVGTLLRERREELGLDLETIGEALRIKPAYLAALEQGLTEDLPGPAYVVGFIRAYAQYLGLDADGVLDAYKAETPDGQSRPDLSLPVPLGTRSLPGVPILLVALILALCGYGTWYYLSTGARTRPERVAAVPAELRQPPLPAAASSSDGTAADAPRLSPGILAPTTAPPPSGAGGDGPSGASATTSPQPASSPAAASPASSAPPGAVAATPAEGGSPSAGSGAAGERGQIDIRALTDCWIQVRAADTQAIVFSHVLKAGQTYHVPRSGLLLRTGNAGALAFVVDGKAAPAIGGVGVLRRNVALDPEALLAGTAARG